jgi:hypothetical protein
MKLCLNGNGRVGVQVFTRPAQTLPLLPRSTLGTLAVQKEEAVAEAKQAIDQILTQLGHRRISRR